MLRVRILSLYTVQWLSMYEYVHLMGIGQWHGMSVYLHLYTLVIVSVFTPLCMWLSLTTHGMWLSLILTPYGMCLVLCLILHLLACGCLWSDTSCHVVFTVLTPLGMGLSVYKVLGI